MSEEIFDVCDENDVVLGQAPRSEVHRRRFLHRAVHIFVMNSADELLIHQRVACKDEYPLLLTSSASGHVSAGESYETSAMRELQEELGLVAPLRFLNKFRASPELANEHSCLYLARTDEPPVFDPGEILTGEFQPVATITERIATDPGLFTPPFRTLFAWFEPWFASQ